MITVFSLIGCIISFIFYIICLKYSNIRCLTNFFLLSSIALPCNAFYERKQPENPEFNEDGSPQGIYLIDKYGKKSSGSHDPYFIFGTLFFCIGMLSYKIWIVFCPLGMLFLSIFIFREYRIQHLYTCPDHTIQLFLKNHAPSLDLRTLLEEHGRIIPTNNIRWKSIEEQPYSIFDYFKPSIILITTMILLYANFYIHDERFYNTEEFTLSFQNETVETGTFAFYENMFGDSVGLIPSEKTLSENVFILEGINKYTENETIFRNMLDNGDPFIISATKTKATFHILTCKSENGETILSEQQSRQRRMDIIEFWLILIGILTVFSIGIASLRIKHANHHIQ